MRDAFDVVKYIIRKFFFDDEYQHEVVIQHQECSWKKILTSNTDTTFKQYHGEKLLNISRTVKIVQLFGPIGNFDDCVDQIFGYDWFGRFR